jgi:6-phospho-beta-glucosidase
MGHTANRMKMLTIGKFAVICGGSTYTPELLGGFITHQDQVRVDMISLYDIQPQRLAQRMFRRAGLATRIELHRELASALGGPASCFRR